MLRAFTYLERRAAGDFSPDTNLETFPSFEPQQRRADTGLSPWGLFEAYVTTRKPARSTVDRQRSVFIQMQKDFPEGSANALTEDQARKWIGGLVTAERAPVTVRDVWLSASRTVFSWGVKHKHVHRNPFSDVHVDVPKKPQLRETKAFTLAEATIILRASLAFENPKRTFQRAQRWVPWLCAYSGARSGELCQLRGRDVEKRDGFYVMKFTPEAGTIKTGNVRTVPLHEHLIEQGFIEFVASIGDGPLFYNPSEDSAETVIDPTNPPRPRYVKTRERLAAWVRDLGVSDPEVSPNHGWRHTFKLMADRGGIPEKMHDAITGHSQKSVARGYGTPPVEDRAAAMKLFPRFTLSDD